jgi:hypothetical protein
MNPAPYDSPLHEPPSKTHLEHNVQRQHCVREATNNMHLCTDEQKLHQVHLNTVQNEIGCRSSGTHNYGEGITSATAGMKCIDSI